MISKLTKVATALLFLTGCQSVSDLPRPANQATLDRLFVPPPAPTPPPLPEEIRRVAYEDPAVSRARLYRVLDAGTEGRDDELHTICGGLTESKDHRLTLHLIAALKAFPDGEPGPKDGIVCTWQHCVDALKSITGADVGYSYSSWKRWYDQKRAAQGIGPDGRASR